MKQYLNTVLTKLFTESQIIKSVTALRKTGKKSCLFADDVRVLSAGEIGILTAQGNSAEDWTEIKVASGFNSDFIRGNIFSGECVLGVFKGVDAEVEPGVILQSGIYNSTIVNSEIAGDCLIKNCGLIANNIVKENTVILNVGSLTAEKNCAFGNGIKIPIGNETGGREVISCADIDISVAELIVTERGDKSLQKSYEDFCRKYLAFVTSDSGIVESKAVLRNTSSIKNAYIGEGAIIDSALLVENSTILSSSEERTEISHGAFVKNSCIQWGCEVTTMAIVADSIMTEHSHAERHGKITASIIGPNTGVAEGEATSCLIGPFVGFHHQSLLIAAVWPGGKGNIGYGANVGSNHTSRAPDQEIFCGEGMFFGLGSSVKFPSDFSCAPYSIIATGVITLPQKVEFPFSLIQSSSVHAASIPPAYNELLPAWVLSDNIYMLRRNEAKYKKRNKAKRTDLNFTVFRPDIIDLMINARDRLAAVKTKKKIYTDKDIPSIGKNYLLEKMRRQAIDAYDFYIEYYCLLGLCEQVSELVKSDNIKIIAALYTVKTESELWEHQRALIRKEGFSKRNIKKNLTRLIFILEQISEGTYKAKEKDDVRGMKIIPDYEEAYIKAGEDSFIVSTRQETANAVKKIKELILSL
jgi:NDP-sugar pyrophosphorylase family protein